MNWDAVGAIGEIVGALVVVITLGYLAIQIRQNTKAVQASALDSSIQAASAIRSHILNSEEVAEIYRLGSLNPTELSETQIVRYRNLMTNIMWSIWNLYAQSMNAGLPMGMWENQSTLIKRVLDNPGGKWYWDKFGNEYEDSCVEEINKHLAKW